MRSVFNEEMDIVWDNYSKIISKVGFKNMLLTPYDKLKEEFTLSYKDLFYQVKDINSYLGKSREEVKYSILKLRRLMVLWQKNKIWTVEGGITYSRGDHYKEFPNFASQNPKVEPTLLTLKRLQAKVIQQYIIDYNKNFTRNKFFSRSKIKYIRNLRDLRNVLVANEKFDEATATKIVALYREYGAQKEINDFSNESTTRLQ